jgi:uncharacterized protein (DUF697 family)
MKTLLQAEKEAREIVNKWAAGATAVSWVPFSAIVLSGADVVMVSSVAAAFEVEGYNVQKVIATAAAGTTGRWLAESLSFIPGPGWIAKAIIAGSITKGMGEGVIAYFRGESALK